MPRVLLHKTKKALVLSPAFSQQLNVLVVVDASEALDGPLFATLKLEPEFRFSNMLSAVVVPSGAVTVFALTVELFTTFQRSDAASSNV
jgi:hypothetical protein